MLLAYNDPGTIWCAGWKSESGYFMGACKSTNGGSSWTRYLLGAASGRAYTIIMDPTDANVLYVGGYSASNPAVFKTANAGGSWTQLSASGISGYVYDLIIDPVDTGILYAATAQGVFKSTNGGSSFTQVSSGFTNTRELLMDPYDNLTIYAGTYSQGVYITDNGGSSWSAMNDGLGEMEINCLAMNPFTYLFAGTEGEAVFRWGFSVGSEGESGAPVISGSLSLSPNPAYGSAVVRYQIDSTAPVELTVFDMHGRLVSTLVNGALTPGAYEAVWDGVGTDGSRAPSGVYLFRLSSGAEVQTDRLVLIR
jgi:hypothetical protein